MDTILDGLAHARTYPYKGKDNLLATVKREQARLSEYVVFSHVDNTAFADLSCEANDDGKCDYAGLEKYDIIPTLIKDYSRLHDLLIVKVPVSGSHEQLHNGLALLINSKVLHMGLDRQLRQMGGATVETRSREKRPDFSFTPRKLPKGRSDKWPTAAIEVGYSESLPKLQADAKFWIMESGGDVGIVLVAKIDRSQRQIVVQKWEAKPSRSQSQVTARLTQNVTISKKAVGGGEEKGQVKEGPLVVEFQKLFLRPAEKPPEADLVIENDDLMDMAEQVWETQRFPNQQGSS